MRPRRLETVEQLEELWEETLGEEVEAIYVDDLSCCFCDAALDEEADDWLGVSLLDRTTDEPGEIWFCHEQCFRKKLHPDYNIEAEPE